MIAGDFLTNPGGAHYDPFHLSAFIVEEERTV